MSELALRFELLNYTNCVHVQNECVDNFIGFPLRLKATNMGKSKNVSNKVPTGYDLLQERNAREDHPTTRLRTKKRLQTKKEKRIIVKPIIHSSLHTSSKIEIIIKINLKFKKKTPFVLLIIIRHIIK